MRVVRLLTTVLLGWAALATVPANAQVRPNLSGIWRLDAGESRMVGAGGQVRAPQLGERQITWQIDHRDPHIGVVVTVRDPEESHEFSFSCVTNGQVCTNELPQLREIRRITLTWDGDTLVMSQEAQTAHGNFAANDRVFLSAAGQTLVFQRVVTDARGERAIRQVFRKVAAPPART
jgi:hypothetical protein